MAEVKPNKFMDFFKQHAIYFVLFLLLCLIVLKDASFLSLSNFSNILTQSSVRLIIALGMAGILISQGTDLSAGRQVGLAAVVSATMLQAADYVNKVYPELGEIPIPVVILLVCFIGAIIGMVNGLIVAYLNVTPFIATLGTMIIVYGMNSIYYDYLGSLPVSGFSESYETFTQEAINIGGFYLSYLTVYATIIAIFIWILWNKTRFGKNIYAIGGNPEAAKVSGVNVARNLIAVYMLAGMLYGFAGLLEGGYTGSATNNLGFMYELDAIAACVVGGVSFAGGVGTVRGVITGVVTFTVINYGLTYIGINPYWQYIIKGSIIILAVSMDSLKYAKKK